MGTEHGGVNRMDPSTEKFKRYRRGAGPNTLSNNTIKRIEVDDNGQLWVGTIDGLNRYNPATDGFEVFKHDSEDPNSLSNNVIGALAVDADGALWVGTNEGLNQLQTVGGEVAFKRYYHDPDNAAGLAGNTVTSLYRSSFGPMWVGCRGSGVSRMDIDEEEPRFRSYQHDDFDGNSLIHNQVLTMFEDRTGSMWIGTYHGISRFDPEKQGFHHVRYKVGNANSLPDRNIWSFSEDQ